MTQKINQEAKIIDAAYKLFLEKGYRHSTVDDIAQALGMSKKTLYKFFSSKSDLLSAAFEKLKLRMTAKVEAILDNRYIPFPLKLKSSLSVVANYLAPINPELFEDLRDHAPEVWEDLMDYINESAFLRFQRLIQEGREQGLVKANLNVGLVVMMYASAVRSLLDPSFRQGFPESIQKDMRIPAADIFDQAITIIYNGIMTEEARAEFENT
ncbi:TetR/AcrR family transcriptional regulator [Algoriphagus limi]|uniref:TetR/AcrR family transcriptional regulator n=1 Tax=Algoriphagus limi TaxID=2975273 RepID=A0ABT2G439_9BACT|nr:TetR/AcrR family transcriptional regulator [Algoriphagus limi]MCS5490029.1 TetR/AcrR family transcriptional regulator [Algoriphagus limi]